MQHVLIIPSWYPSNAKDVGGSFFREQALALRHAGFKVGIITPSLRSIHQPKSFIGKYGCELSLENEMPVLRLHGLKLFPYSQKWNLLYWEFLGLRIFKEYIKKYGKPDVLHVHSMIYSVAWAKVIFQKYHIPYIITEHSSEFALGKINTYLLNYLAEAVAKAAERVAVSTSLARTLQVKFRGAGTGSYWNVVANMVDARFFMPHTNAISNLFVFSNVASLVRNKSHSELIIAFAKSFHQAKNILLKIYGDGPERSKLEKIVAELNLTEQVHFEGAVSREQLPQMLSESNAFVLSSKYETFNVAIIEALAMGLPVISTACGGPQDIVREGKDGFLVSVDNIDEMAHAMQKMKENISSFDSKLISESCKSRFSADTYVKSYAYIYDKVLINKKNES